MLSEKTFNFLNNLSVLICFLLFTCQRPFKVFCWIPTKKYFTRNILSSIFTFIALVGSSGFEPPTLRLSGARSNHLSYEPVSLYVGGDEGIRTLDPLLAGQVLSQLSYTPVPLYFRSPGLFPLLGSLFSLRFSSSSRAMKTEQQAFIPDSVLLLFFCRDSFFSISTSESSTVVMIRVSLERRWSSRTFRYGYLVTT